MPKPRKRVQKRRWALGVRKESRENFQKFDEASTYRKSAPIPTTDGELSQLPVLGPFPLKQPGSAGKKPTEAIFIWTVFR